MIGPWDDAIAPRLRAALASSPGLPEADVASIGVLIDAGEWALALDVLCTQVYEYDLPVSPDQRGELVALGTDLDVDAVRLLGGPSNGCP